MATFILGCLFVVLAGICAYLVALDEMLHPTPLGGAPTVRRCTGPRSSPGCSSRAAGCWRWCCPISSATEFVSH
jgi:hypothetical protein